MIPDRIRAALTSAINAGVGPTALSMLPTVKYPKRQLQIIERSDDMVEVHFHYRYKNHRLNASVPDPEDLRLSLNAVLPNGLYVTAVDVAGTHLSFLITIYGGYF